VFGEKEKRPRRLLRLCARLAREKLKCKKTKTKPFFFSH